MFRPFFTPSAVMGLLVLGNAPPNAHSISIRGAVPAVPTFGDAPCPNYAVAHEEKDGSWCYATMDKCTPAAKHRDGRCALSCQDAMLRLDAGWEIAPHTHAAVGRA